MKVLKAPVLKMTLFLLHKIKATMPITTIKRKRGVSTAMIHRLLGGVFTTATNIKTYKHYPSVYASVYVQSFLSSLATD